MSFGAALLNKKAETLAEKFQYYRYETGGFVSGFTLRRRLGLAQGFDTYDTPPITQNRRWGNKTAFKALKWLEKQSGPVFCGTTVTMRTVLGIDGPQCPSRSLR